MMSFINTYMRIIAKLKNGTKLKMKESIIDKIVIDTKINLRQIKEKIKANINGKYRTKRDKNK